MHVSDSTLNVRPGFDPLMVQVAEYADTGHIQSKGAFETARYCLMDTVGCGLLALNYPACVKLLAPVVPGTTVPNGSRVPGTSHVLDPVLAALNIASIVRWLGFDDTCLAAQSRP